MPGGRLERCGRTVGDDPCGLSGPWCIRDGGSAASFCSAVGSRQTSRSCQIPARATETACAVELTEVHSGGETWWWSLGFEATGPVDLFLSTPQATAALIFAQGLPGDDLDFSHCQSYAEWLPNAGSELAT